MRWLAVNPSRRRVCGVPCRMGQSGPHVAGREVLELTGAEVGEGIDSLAFTSAGRDPTVRGDQAVRLYVVSIEDLESMVRSRLSRCGRWRSAADFLLLRSVHQVRIRALGYLAMISYARGDLDPSSQQAESALALARDVGDKRKWASYSFWLAKWPRIRVIRTTPVKSLPRRWSSGFTVSRVSQSVGTRGLRARPGAPGSDRWPSRGSRPARQRRRHVGHDTPRGMGGPARVTTDPHTGQLGRSAIRLRPGMVGPWPHGLSAPAALQVRCTRLVHSSSASRGAHKIRLSPLRRGRAQTGPTTTHHRCNLRRGCAHHILPTHRAGSPPSGQNQHAASRPSGSRRKRCQDASATRVTPVYADAAT